MQVHRMRLWARSCAALSIALVVAPLGGCGGGGGGGAGGGGESAPAPIPAPPAARTSGLVPVAPTTGTVLQTDATTLRVLRPGATWTYSGEDRPDGTSGAVVAYTNVVVHAQAAAGVTELSSDGLHTGEDSVNVQATAGVVKSPQSFQPVSTAPPESIDAVELRSPVRTSDQYTLYDRHFDDAGLDLDGDRKNEAFDIAVWSRVIGTEVIDLPNRRAVQTVRVDTTLASRVRFSQTGVYGAVEQVVQSVWYATGVGIVQVQLDQPNRSAGGPRHLTTERLDTWDGLTEGLGSLPLQAAIVLGGESAGLRLQSPIDAVAFDDHAVVMSLIPNRLAFDGVTLSVIDRSGRVSTSTNQYGITVAGTTFMPQRLLRAGSELRLLGLADDGLFLLGFDARGQALSMGKRILAGGSLHSVGSQWSQSASAGNRIWLMWMRRYANALSEDVCDLMLQSFDFAGQAQGTPTMLEQNISPGALQDLRMAAAPDRVVASWLRQGMQRYVVADASNGEVLAVKDLGVPTQYFSLQPLALGPGLALVMGSDTVFGGVAVVSLNGSYDPMRSTSGSLASEIVSQPWMEPVAATVAVGHDGRLFLATLDMSGSAVLSVSELSWAAGAAATSGSLQLMAHMPLMTYPLALPYADRVLMIGTTQEGMVATAVWRLR